MEKFYITAPWIKGTVISKGDGRLDAVANSGITVWTEAEYQSAKSRIGDDIWLPMIDQCGEGS